MAIIILSGLLTLTILFLTSAIIHIQKIQQQLEIFDREQHNQNMDIIKIMNKITQHDEMLLQHIEILKYLVEQDPKLNAGKIYFTGPMGEA